MNMLLPKSPRLKCKAITDFARGQDCTLRLFGVCNGNPETTVFCHLPGHLRGMAMKENDLHGAFGCSCCHDVIDRRVRVPEMTDAMMLDAMLRALSATQAILVREGLIRLGRKE